MFEPQYNQQKIVVSCIAVHDNKILLVRGSQVYDKASSRSMGYFSIPRFTVGFGMEPEQALRDAFLDHFNQVLEDVSIVSTTQRLTDMEKTHEVEIIYRANVPRVTEKVRKFIFVDKNEVDRYMFKSIYNHLI